jgi:hypothetical protein
MTDIKKIEKKINKMMEENDKRIEDYKKNGGGEHLYLDGKAQAFEEVLSLFRLGR